MLPFSSIRFPCSATPIKVPIVSKISVNKKVKKTPKNLRERTPAHSNLKRNGALGTETGLKFSGTAVTPKGIPITVVAAMPIRIAPGTLRM